MTSIQGQPLSGRTVVVTRARAQAASLIEPLESLGADVIAFPVIETVDPEDWAPADDAIGALNTFDWTVFTSTNAVERFLGRLASTGRDGLPEQMKVAAVGTGTQAALEERGVSVDLVPEEFHGEGLAGAFRDIGAGPGWRILIPRALKGREILPETLESFGASVVVVPVYRTVPATPDPAAVERLGSGGVDVVTFTSPSTVTNFLAVLEHAGLDPDAVMSGVQVASIGPVTLRALSSRGYGTDIEAIESTVEGLVQAVAESYA